MTWVAIWILAPMAVAMGQGRFNVPHQLCAGTDTVITFGFLPSNNIVVDSRQSTMGHSEVTFLPDGIPCNNRCSYHSPVTFTDFPDTATIHNVEDILYVRLNMEHSFLDDIYISITCPNGQEASLMRYSNRGSSFCNSQIPQSHRGWLPGSNASGGTFLGEPIDGENSLYPCDSGASGNEHGRGWNYCWSNSTTHGYSYAPGDGIIYRYANVVGNGWRTTIDSSNVAAGTNFYHPDQSFNNLIGCPLNGEWAIKVMDGWSADNGYIFEWEMALDPELIPPMNCDPETYLILGPWTSPINDSTFLLSIPSDIYHDTTITYTYLCISTCGDTLRHEADLTIHRSYDSTYLLEGCTQCSWKNHIYTYDTLIYDSQTSVHGCDSISYVNIDIHPAYYFQYSDTIVENDLPYSFLGHSLTSDTLLHDTTAFGCDSNYNFSLVVYPNKHSHEEYTLCDNATPFHWNGLAFNSSTDTTLFSTTSHGADSIASLHLVVLPTSHTNIVAEAVENELPAHYLGHDFYRSTDTTVTYTNVYGCDSTVNLNLTVYRNHAYLYSKQICDNQLPYLWDGQTFSQADTLVLQLLDRHGADSVVSLALSVNPTYEISRDTVICDNTAITFGKDNLSIMGYYTDSLTTVAGCDSIIHLTLSTKPHSEFHIFDTICPSQSYPFPDSALTRSGIYTLNSVNSVGCDSILQIHLHVLDDSVKAQIKAIPYLVTTINPDYRLIDQSRYAISRLWSVDSLPYTDKTLSLTYPLEADSVAVQLVAVGRKGCTDTTHAAIHIDRAKIFIPNVFTPTREDNNRWYPITTDILSMEIWIYNRQGLLVKHLEGTDAYWDGTTDDNIPCPQGGYVYNLKYRTIPRPDQPQTLTGTILLIR